MDDTLARGYAAQNQMFATVGSLLLGQNQAPEAVQAARTANAMKIPAYQADQTTIQNTFMTVVKEIKKEAGSDWSQPSNQQGSHRKDVCRADQGAGYAESDHHAGSSC